MPDNKRKRASPHMDHALIDAPSMLRSKGFSTRDERLPASPPMADASLGLMSALRARYRDAVDRLFGAIPVVLNEPCAFHHTAVRHHHVREKRDKLDDIGGGGGGANDSASDSDAIDTDTDDSDTHEHRLQPRQFGDDVPMRLAKRGRREHHASDQVVPGGEGSEDTSATSATSATASEVPVPHCNGRGAGEASAICNDRACFCANSLWTAGGVGPEVMLRTAEELSERIIVLYGRAIDAATNQVDYASLVHSPDFHQYLTSARKLRYFDPLLLTHTGRKAFFLNVYNSLMIHAITVMSKPRSMFDRISMYNTAAYNIGGRPYTLNMIEHGVLRSNRCGAGPFAQPSFGQGDARRLCALPSVDPRIHFALNCGAVSCPPVRFYDARNLDQALDSATRAYLLDLQVDYEVRTVTLPKLLHWYQADFCHNGSVDAVIQWTVPYLCMDKRMAVERLLREKKEEGMAFKVVYASYDWTVNDRSL